MKLFIKSLTFISLLTPMSSSFSAETETLFYGHQLKRLKVLEVAKEGIVLKRALALRADRIIINGDIVTKGYQLLIDADTVEFRNGAKIIGFLAPPQARTMVPEPIDQVPPRAGRSGYDGLKGTQGYTGTTGYKGHDGKQDVRPIYLLSESIVGDVVINGNGQNGGLGGKGGRGGTGGPGGNGKNGHVRGEEFGSGDGRGGGNAGEGGDAGLGGDGGPGGKGGKSIDLFITASDENIKSNIKAVAIGGEGGLGGLTGEYGAVGTRGSAGSGACDDEWFGLGEDCVGGGRGASDGRINESAQARKNREGRKGADGEKGIEPKLMSSNSIQYNRERINLSVDTLHFQRMYLKNLIDLISFITEKPVLQDFDERDSYLEFIELMADADQYFIDSIVDSIEIDILPYLKTNDLSQDLSENLKGLVKYLKNVKTQTLSENIESFEELFEESKYSISDSVESLADQCYSFNKLVEGFMLPIIPRSMEVNICRGDGITRLKKDFNHRLVMREEFKDRVDTNSYTGNISVAYLDSDNNRFPSSGLIADGIIINNARILQKDIFKSLMTNSGNEWVKSYEVPLTQSVPTYNDVMNRFILLGNIAGVVNEK